jgi:hypothetical protein
MYARTDPVSGGICANIAATFDRPVRRIAPTRPGTNAATTDAEV